MIEEGDGIQNMNIRPTHIIVANETVSISDFKKSPGQYFTDHAIAVLSSNRPAGYIIGASAYEELVSMLSQCQQTEAFSGEFTPTASRMREITVEGMELLINVSSDDLEKLGNCSK